MNELDRILASDGDVSPSTWLLSSVMDEIRFERRQVERRGRFWLRAAIGAAGTALCTVVTLVIICSYS